MVLHHTERFERRAWETKARKPGHPPFWGKWEYMAAVSADEGLSVDMKRGVSDIDISADWVSV